jgi:hypothetical protein
MHLLVTYIRLPSKLHIREGPGNVGNSCMWKALSKAVAAEGVKIMSSAPQDALQEGTCNCKHT